MNNWKGIVLAGGAGTRLHPITKGITKQLLPVYDKPLIYYPISVLMLAGIQNILIITTPEDLTSFQRLLGDGSDFGVTFQYALQSSPNGLAEAFIIGENFIGNNNVCLILGDNIFYGQGLKEKLDVAMTRDKGASVFIYQVRDPERFGVVELDEKQCIISIEEKPKKPKSNYAMTGLYFYDNQVINISKSITLSKRGELEITDVNKIYLRNNLIYADLFGRGFAWLDTGTHDSLIEASNFVQTIEHRQGLKIACLEEIGCRNGWITPDDVIKLGEQMGTVGYGKYLIELGKELRQV